MQALSRHPSRRSGYRSAQSPAGDEGRVPLVVALESPSACDPSVTGRKAATLAEARRRGFPVLDGFVITTAGAAALTVHGPGGDAVRAEVDAAWEALSEAGARALVVRSSSPGEDGSTSSMAGQFASVLHVIGHDAFVAAVDRVIASAAAHPGAGGTGSGDDTPMAVLVQPQVFPRWGGVLFGIDPVSGRTDRLALATVEGGPDGLVSGAVGGTRATLNRRGRVVAFEGAGGTPLLAGRERRSLARLAVRAGRQFGAPQDIEWAVDGERGVLLLQSRPITAVGAAPAASAPVLGPGPVAETFPDPLSPLEADLWLRPLRVALAEAVLLTGAASRRRVAASPVVTAVGGRAAADLGLLGLAPRRRSLLQRLDPRPPALRLRAAWRTGRLRMALPALAEDLVQRADAELAAVGRPSAMSDDALLGALRGSHQALVSLHAHEILAGMLATLPDEGGGGAGQGGITSAGVALHVVAAARAEGLSDEAIVARHPVVLSLVAPAIGAPAVLPDLLVLPPGAGDGGPADPLAAQREALRLRVRWVEELTAVVAAELGHRLARRRVLPDAEAVRWLGADEMEAAVTAGQVPDDLEARRTVPTAAPLPAAFRLTAGGVVVPVALATSGGGQGAGGGRALGRVVHAGEAVPSRGDVLVTRTLDPALAPLLPLLGGLVAETGSVLSHLAILARELSVPTVVGVAGALERFPGGSFVVVDGTAGEVTTVETAGAA